MKMALAFAGKTFSDRAANRKHGKISRIRRIIRVSNETSSNSLREMVSRTIKPTVNV